MWWKSVNGLLYDKRMQQNGVKGNLEQTLQGGEIYPLEMVKGIRVWPFWKMVYTQIKMFAIIRRVIMYDTNCI